MTRNKLSQPQKKGSNAWLTWMQNIANSIMPSGNPGSGVQVRDAIINRKLQGVDKINTTQVSFIPSDLYTLMNLFDLSALAAARTDLNGLPIFWRQCDISIKAYNVSPLTGPVTRKPRFSLFLVYQEAGGTITTSDETYLEDAFDSAISENLYTVKEIGAFELTEEAFFGQSGETDFFRFRIGANIAFSIVKHLQKLAEKQRRLEILDQSASIPAVNLVAVLQADTGLTPVVVQCTAHYVGEPKNVTKTDMAV